MNANERKVTVELVSFGVVKEYVTLPASEASALLRKAMAWGHHWRIVGPDKTGEIRNDEARYAADCEACGVENAFA